MNIRNIFWGVIGLFVICGQAQAACRLVGNPFGATKVQFNINIGTVSGVTTASLGAAFASYTYPAPSRSIIDANNYLGCQLGDVEKFTASYGSPVAGYPGVYNTNLAGIGYRITYSDGTTVPPMSWTNSYGTAGSTDNGGIIYFPPGQFKFELIKTAMTVGYGTLRTGQYGSDDVPSNQAVQISVTNGGTIISGGCSIDVNSQNKAVALDSLAIDLFSGVGSVQGKKPFSLHTTCANSEPNLMIQYNGTADSSGFPGTLALSGNSTATGVGIQVLHKNGTPIQLGQFETPEVISNGVDAYGNKFSMDFSAQYLQTQPTIRPGSVSATATFTLQFN